MAKKNITIDDLATIMQKGFVKIEKDTDKKIDDLATMVQKGFNGVDKCFEQVDKRFEQVDKHFEQVDKRFEGIDKRLDNIEGTMVTKAEMNRRFDGLEDRVLASHQKRIEKLENEVKELREMFAA